MRTIVFGPLLNGSTTSLYVRPADPARSAIWWADRRGSTTRARCSRRPPPCACSRSRIAAYMKSARRVVAALSVPGGRAARRAHGALGRRCASGVWPIVDNYWQTETGWADPLGAAVRRGGYARRKQVRLARRVPVLRLRRAASGCTKRRGEDPSARTTRAVLSHFQLPLPPGCIGRRSGGDDARLRADVLPQRCRAARPTRTFDWATRDADGYYFVLGRRPTTSSTFAGHRLGHARRARKAVAGASGHCGGRRGRPSRTREGQIPPSAFAVARDGPRTATEEGAAGRGAFAREVKVGGKGAVDR
jgi:propionyl-CoA synthetase